MKPSIVGGDLVIYYRFDKNYVASDAVVVKYQGKFITSRVMAVAGDTVDISENGLIINGALQQEPEIRSATNLFSNKVKFPLTLGEGQVFLLGDNRANATDSRIFGPVNCSATYGKVITLLRRRNI